MLLFIATGTIRITLFLKSLDRGMPGLKFCLYLFIENISTNSKTFHLWFESLINGCRTSNGYLPSMLCSRLIRTCFSVAYLHLDENDGTS